MNTPSAFQLGDQVIIDLGKGRIIDRCEVCGVNFSPSKVTYDLLVTVLLDDNVSSETFFWGIDSSFVKDCCSTDKNNEPNPSVIDDGEAPKDEIDRILKTLWAIKDGDRFYFEAYGRDLLRGIPYRV